MDLFGVHCINFFVLRCNYVVFFACSLWFKLLFWLLFMLFTFSRLYKPYKVVLGCFVLFQVCLKMFYVVQVAVGWFL